MKRHGFSAEDMARVFIEPAVPPRRRRRVDWPVALGWSVYLVLVIVGAVALVWG